MDDLQRSLLNLLAHLNQEKIITLSKEDNLTETSFTDLIVLLKQKLQETYPDTKLKRLMKSVHYANGFPDEALKQSAFPLDDIEQYLALNNFLDHDTSVAYFNAAITSEGFIITPESLVTVMIDSLLFSNSPKSRLLP